MFTTGETVGRAVTEEKQVWRFFQPSRTANLIVKAIFDLSYDWKIYIQVLDNT